MQGHSSVKPPLKRPLFDAIDAIFGCANLEIAQLTRALNAQRSKRFVAHPTDNWISRSEGNALFDGCDGVKCMLDILQEGEALELHQVLCTLVLFCKGGLKQRAEFLFALCAGDKDNDRRLALNDVLFLVQSVESGLQKLGFVSKQLATFDLTVVAAQPFVASVAVPSTDTTPSVEAALAPVVPLEFSQFFEWLLHGSYPRLLFELIRTLPTGMTVFVSLQQRQI